MVLDDFIRIFHKIKLVELYKPSLESPSLASEWSPKTSIHIVKAYTNPCLIKQVISHRMRSPSSLYLCWPLRGHFWPSLFLILDSASTYFLDIKCWVYSSESPICVSQTTWNVLTLTLAYLLWYYTITILTSNSDLCFDLCIHDTHVSPFPLLHLISKWWLLAVASSPIYSHALLISDKCW